MDNNAKPDALPPRSQAVPDALPPQSQAARDPLPPRPQAVPDAVPPPPQATTFDPLPPLLQAALDGLPEGLRLHIGRVRGIAAGLAARHRLDARRVDVAAAAHDVARAEDGAVLLQEAQALGVRITDADRHKPMLLHGPVGAGRLRAQLGVADAAVLEAVYWHTTGLAAMGPIAKAVFLADKFDLTKAGRYPHIDRVKELAEGDMDGAIAAFLRGDLVRLLNEGALVHPASVEALNGLLLALRAR